MLPAIQNFRISRLTFAPRLVPTLAALAALGLTLYLGTWQQGRADEKRALQAQFDERANLPTLVLNDHPDVDARAKYRRTTATGEYDAAGQFYVDNKSEGMVVGYHVFSPLRLAGTARFVLVNRGFVARGATFPVPPPVSIPAGVVEVTGMLVIPTSRFLELGGSQAATATALPITAMQGNVWQNITIDRYREQTGRDTVPLVLLANPTDAGLIARLERPDARAGKHVEYMLTWYSLAATVVILWLVVNLEFNRQSNQRN